MAKPDMENIRGLDLASKQDEVVLKCRNKITNYARNIPATGSPPD
jgi:hypothetical protein